MTDNALDSPVTSFLLSEMEGPRLSKYIRSPGHKSYKVCVLPYRKGPALRRRASSWWKTTGIGLELDFNFQVNEEHKNPRPFPRSLRPFEVISELLLVELPS